MPVIDDNTFAPLPGIPVGVEDYYFVGGGDVQPYTTSSGGDEEHKLLRVVVELIDSLCTYPYNQSCQRKQSCYAVENLRSSSAMEPSR